MFGTNARGYPYGRSRVPAWYQTRSPFGTNPTRSARAARSDAVNLYRPSLVGIPHDDRGVAQFAEHAPQLTQDALHPVQVLVVRRAVRQVHR